MSKKSKKRVVRNPIAVAMRLRYGKTQTTHASGPRRSKDQRAKDERLQRDD